MRERIPAGSDKLVELLLYGERSLSQYLWACTSAGVALGMQEPFYTTQDGVEGSFFKEFPVASTRS